MDDKGRCEFDPNTEYPPTPLRLALLRRNNVKCGGHMGTPYDPEFSLNPYSRVIPLIPSSPGKKCDVSPVGTPQNIPTEQTVCDCDTGRYIEDEKLCTIDTTPKSLLHMTSDSVMSDVGIYARLDAEWKKMKTLHTQATVIKEKARDQFLELKQHYSHWADTLENRRDMSTETNAKLPVIGKGSRLPLVTMTTASIRKPSRLPVPIIPTALPHGVQMTTLNSGYSAEKTEMSKAKTIPKFPRKVKRGRRFFTDQINSTLVPSSK